MAKRYIVRLTVAEREQLEQLVSSGKSAAYRIKHAHILLKADADGPAWSDEQIARAFGCHRNTVGNVRERFVEKRATPGRTPVCDGQAEAQLIALRCGPAPAGQARWTLRLLADKAVELEIVPTICHETVRQVLKKTNFARI
jgi:hypothetical protein